MSIEIGHHLSDAHDEFDHVPLWTTPPNVTCGTYKTEQEAAKHFDELIYNTGSFEIEREVSGIDMCDMPERSKVGFRIDRILFPSAWLQEQWPNAVPIGVEIKRSGLKVSGPLAQALDYRRSWWRCREHPATRIGFSFVFPYWPREDGIAEGMMINNRIGGVWDTGTALQFKCGRRRLIEIGHDGSLAVWPMSYGNKSGSRPGSLA